MSTAQRLVSLADLRITESNFSTLQRDQVRTVVADILAAVRPEDRLLALDRVLANLDESQIIPKNVDGVKADPPPIFFSKTPAVLVNVDGDPIWSAIPGNDLQYAVNTNWDLFEHAPTQTLYLRVNDTWLKAPALRAPGPPRGRCPTASRSCRTTRTGTPSKAALPGKKIAPKDVPRVFATTTPAELILLTGEPAYLPVAGTTGLLWVSNTDSDVFRMGRTGPGVLPDRGPLVLGARFRRPVDVRVAEAARRLQEDSRSSIHARASSRPCPARTQAAEAVLLAQIPQTASVGRELKAPAVAYQGTPEFQPIEKTTVQRAVNTDKDIIKVGDLYYMCFQGVWFMSRTATGPWEVTGDVPKAIYEIPVSSPSYSVTYVTVQSATPTTVVYVAAPAYSGVMVAWGCAVWGTGYYYPPYVYYGVYPVYYPHYPTYGYAAAYNPWTGAYTRGAVAYGPVRRRRGRGSIQPHHRGVLARRGGLRSVRRRRRRASLQPAHRRLRPDRAGGERLRQLGVDQRPARRPVGQHAADDEQRDGRDDADHAVERGLVGERHRSRRHTSAVAKSDSGDLYAGHDGNVYKKSDSGSWQKYDNGSWNSVQQPTPAQKQQAQTQATSRASGAAANPSTMSQVQRDSAARTSGAERTSTYSRGGGGSSYRPSGGSRRK